MVPYRDWRWTVYRISCITPSTQLGDHPDRSPLLSGRYASRCCFIIIIGQPLCPVVGRRPQHAVSKLPCLVLSSAISRRSSICPGRLSTAWLGFPVVFSCHMVSKWWHARSIGRLWGGWYALPRTISWCLRNRISYDFSLVYMSIFIQFLNKVVKRTYIIFSRSMLFRKQSVKLITSIHRFIDHINDKYY